VLKPAAAAVDAENLDFGLLLQQKVGHVAAREARNTCDKYFQKCSSDSEITQL
jgi:hypothetical protein